MFSELRKFKVGMILDHQYMHQLDEYIDKQYLEILERLFHLELELKMQSAWQKKCFLNLMFRI